MTIPPNNDTTAEGIKYLALGDSYTIGEGVPVGDRYPVQAAKILRNSGIPVGTPMIVAQTGWTSIDLNNVLESQPITDTFDIVTVCIGVNDQYQGRTVEGYKPWFHGILQKAIAFAGGRPHRVVVLSIPDWGVTPFAANRDKDEIAGQIDVYNEANREIARKLKVHYLDITQMTREVEGEPELITKDGLHYSGQEMAMWAARLAAIIKGMFPPPMTPLQ